MLSRQPGALRPVEGSHAGAKSQRVCWLGNKNLIFTFGFSRSSGRELKVWDPKKMDAPVWQDEVDVASGVLMPMYDPDLHVLYLGGKGDGNIRYFEVKDDGSLFYLSQFSANSPQAGLCSVPQRGAAVARAFSLAGAAAVWAAVHSAHDSAPLSVCLAPLLVT